MATTDSSNNSTKALLEAGDSNNEIYFTLPRDHTSSVITVSIKRKFLKCTIEIRYDLKNLLTFRRYPSF